MSLTYTINETPYGQIINIKPRYEVTLNPLNYRLKFSKNRTWYITTTPEPLKELFQLLQGLNQHFKTKYELPDEGPHGHVNVFLKHNSIDKENPRHLLVFDSIFINKETNKFKPLFTIF